MYNTEKAKEMNITLEDILSKISEQDIFERYMGKFKVGMIYNSPFRKDKNPSFGIFKSRKGNLMFKDHGSGECGDVVKFVGLMTGKTSYPDILSQIHRDLRLKSKSIINNKPMFNKSVIDKDETVIGIVRQPLTQIDVDFWQQFGISEKTLKKFDVFSISHYLCNGVVKGIYKPDEPMYAYKVYEKFKIYRPLSNKFVKWRSNLTEYDIQGYKQLPQKGDVLFITKSLKDAMSLYELGYNAISPSSESSFIPDIVLQDVLKRFKRVIILFDRDKAGVQYTRKFSLKTGLEAIFLHKKYNAKDISDGIQKWGKEEIKKFLQSVIK